MIEISAINIIYFFLAIAAAVITAAWALTHRLVFKPLDVISKDIKIINEHIVPKIITLESDVDYLKTKGCFGKQTIN